ncbi:SRPBCC family protein [Halorubrum sp. CSM-61]|uniref:SRPBCC family protein n=1 Tax=Halorubrum sp. CSM-61 TaxID=2485838 RepID=UPI000F4C5414|nr:SRPBCC family protein [Halorubrum sp. CSM-61]
MTTFEYEIEIAAPVERVFAFDSTPENWPRTMAGLRDFEVLSETDTGANMRATYALLGTAMDMEMEMTVVEPNEEIAVTVDGDGMHGETRNRYVASGDGTRIVHRTDYEMGDSLLDRLLGPVARRYNERQLRTHLENTRDIIEAEIEAEAATAA